MSRIRGDRKVSHSIAQHEHTESDVLPRARASSRESTCMSVFITNLAEREGTGAGRSMAVIPTLGVVGYVVGCPPALCLLFLHFCLCLSIFPRFFTVDACNEGCVFKASRGGIFDCLCVLGLSICWVHGKGVMLLFWEGLLVVKRVVVVMYNRRELRMR